MGTAPFTFGRVAEGDDFVDRDEERARLVQNFRGGVNTAIISPRRWGKSSLVARVAQEVAGDKGLRVVAVDTYAARTEADFYAQLARAVLKATASRWDELADLARRLLARLRPKVVFSADPTQEFSLDLDWDEVRQDPGELLDLAETAAVEKGLRLVVAIDEFQAVAGFGDPAAFQRLLRSHWQRHQHVSYCLYGSKRHMLLDIFDNPDRPFYRFGDIIALGKIANSVWGTFVAERFAATGKRIGADDARYLAGRVDDHPYYVQQLAQQVWFRTDDVATRDLVDTALDDLRDQLGLLFTSLANSLTAKQVGLIRALLAGEPELTAAATLQRYKLGTSANVARMKESLAAREIIDVAGGRVELLDPVFGHWLRTRCFAPG